MTLDEAKGSLDRVLISVMNGPSPPSCPDKPARRT